MPLRGLSRMEGGILHHRVDDQLGRRNTPDYDHDTAGFPDKEWLFACLFIEPEAIARISMTVTAVFGLAGLNETGARRFI